MSERKHNASRRWSLWSLPPPVLWYVLVVGASAVGALAWSVWSPIGWADPRVAAAIGAAMLVHQYLSRDSERVHRARRRSPHVDLGWVWVFPGAVLLPPLLAVALVLLMCAQRWWLFYRVDGRPPHRRLFNAAVWVLSAVAASVVVTASGRRAHLSTDPGGWLDLATMVLAAAVAYALNAGLVAGVLALANGARRPRELFGEAGENLIDAGSLLLGACVVLAVAWWPPLVALIVLPAVALHRTVLIQHLEAAARIDEKTGVLNSFAWHQLARAALARAHRADRATAVFMIDMDGFKQVNDEHGHLAGDAVLQRVAGALAAEVRQTDAIGRVGGDEFAVLLPATDVSAALAVAERIRRAVRELVVPVSGGLSTSIGVAVHPHVGDGTVEGLLVAADGALYEAKHSGRNRVCLAGKVAIWRARRPAVRPGGHDQVDPAAPATPRPA